MGRSMGAAKETVRLAGSVLTSARQVCAFFHTTEEKYRVVLPFIREGLERGERVVHVIEPATQPDYLRRLEAAGIDVERSQRHGQLELRHRQEAYLQDGRFDQEKMLALIEASFLHGRDRGVPLTRFIADMHWPEGQTPGVEDLVRYQQRLNELSPRYDDVIVSTYDCARFGAGFVMDILRTHPIVIIGGILQKNPFFVSPDELLSELRERRTRNAVRHENDS